MFAMDGPLFHGTAFAFGRREIIVVVPMAADHRHPHTGGIA